MADIPRITPYPQTQAASSGGRWVWAALKPTSIVAAEKSGRHWIGIDVTSLAIGVIERRMDEDFEAAEFAVKGLLEDLDDALDLADRDPFQFQWWVAARIGAQPRDGRKRGADNGINGILTFTDDPHGRPKSCIVSVKSGRRVGPDDVRALSGTVQARKAAAGVFVTLRPPSKAMEREARPAGVYHAANERDYPRIQILTSEQTLRNELPDLPFQESQYRKLRSRHAPELVQQPYLFD